MIGREHGDESLTQLPGFAATGLFWAAVTSARPFVRMRRANGAFTRLGPAAEVTRFSLSCVFAYAEGK